MQVRKKALHELSHLLLIFNLKLLYTGDKIGSIKRTLDEKQNERREAVERIWREGTLLWEDGPIQCYFFKRMNNITMCQVTPSSEYMSVAAAHY